MASSWQGGSLTKVCLAAALAGSVGLALYYGYRKRQQSAEGYASESKKEQDETKKKEIAKDAAKRSSGIFTSENVAGETEFLKSSVLPATNHAEELYKDKAKPKQLLVSAQDEAKKKAEQLKVSAGAAADAVKEKAGELKSSIDSSLTESSFSMLGDDKDDKKDDLATKDDNDIVVIEETTKQSQREEVIVPEAGIFAESLPPLPDRQTSLSAFELSSIESDSGRGSAASPESSTDQPQSLSTYEFPSLGSEKSKNGNESDIEVLNNEEKSKQQPEKPPSSSDTPGTSHIPKAKKDSKKSSASEESKTVEAKKEPKGKGRKGSKEGKDIKRTHSKDETDSPTASSTEGKPKGKEASKPKPPPVPPKPKAKPEISQQISKDQEVHIRHPTSSGEFVSFGMRFESEDSTPDHVITAVEDGGPASEVGLKDGDMVLKLNDMDVTHWSRAVLLEQFRMIPSPHFELTVKRNDHGKNFSVHIKDESDGVAVSGEVIDVRSIPKSNVIDIKFEKGPEAVKKCHVVSQGGACAKVTDKGLCLQEKLVDDESFNFEKITFKDGDSNVVILRTSHKGSPVYITVLNRSTVGVQYETEEDVTQLETADPRCFYLIKTRGGSYWLESTQFPDHYLCCKGNQFSLIALTQASEVATNKHIRFTFEKI